MILHGYFRSSAAYRVRIALNLKGVGHGDVFHPLRKGDQRSPAYLAINPQGLVPALDVDGAILTQSIAICEYLDEAYPEPPLLPADPLARAQVRAVALAIACDVHPLQNLRVLNQLRDLGIGKEGVVAWARGVIEEGLDACAQLMEDQAGPYCFGDRPTLADICLVPQLANARRFGARTDFGRIEAIEAACLALPAFADAAPAMQADAAD